MSFLDKAKQKLKGVPRGLGEETVRIVNYDDQPEHETPESIKTAPKPRPPVKPKVEVKNFFKSDPKEKTKANPKPEVFALPNTEASVEAEEKSGLFGKKKKTDVVDIAAEELLNVEKSKIKDVLEILEIPDTFDIESNVFLPEDINDVTFDFQAPHGYDIGQVSAWIDQARSSIEQYVKLLRLRNDHVAKLATVVDRLQVDLNNQRFDREIANGINIMPTQDDDDLANQNMELKLLVRRLQDELSQAQSGDNLSSSERATFENLQDELSIAERDNAILRQDNYELKTRVSYMEEDLGIDSVEEDQNNYDSDFSYDENDTVSTNNAETQSNVLPMLDDELPNFDLDDSSGLPEIEQNDNSHFAPTVQASSAFYGGDDQPLDEFIADNQDSYEGQIESGDDGSSMIEMLGDSMDLSDASQVVTRYSEDDDDEDPLDAIMKEEWGK